MSVGDNFTNPANKGVSITPSDSTNLDVTARALYIGTGGDVSVETAGGSSLTFVGVPGGTVLPVMVHRVNATGTTAENILALW